MGKTLEELEQMLLDAQDRVEAIEDMIEDYWQQDFEEFCETTEEEE